MVMSSSLQIQIANRTDITNDATDAVAVFTSLFFISIISPSILLFTSNNMEMERSHLLYYSWLLCGAYFPHEIIHSASFFFLMSYLTPPLT